MGDSNDEKLDKEVQYLEKINELIDLCIDSQQFDYIDKIITKGSRGEITTTLIENLRQLEKKSVINSLITLNGVEKPEEGHSIFGTDDCPIQFVFPTKDFEDCLPEKFRQKLFPLDTNKLTRKWSQLFAAKLVRAELQRQNRKPWLDLYEDLHQYLESNIPILLPNESSKAWKRTLFNYLMELSAVSWSEASFGYAERARSLIKHISGVPENVRDDHGTPYDRWIWYNLGLAYKHMARHQDALEQFNIVLSKFWKSVDNRDKPKNSNDSLEFLLNIYPAIMRRTELNLQIQLGYHALQTLADSKSNKWLEHIRNNGGFFEKVVDNWYKQKEILIIEALLTLGEQEEASERYFPHSYENPETKERIFEKLTWDNAKSKLPVYSDNNTNGITGRESSDPPPSLIQVGLIEQTVSWYIEKASQLLQRLKNPGKREDEVDFKKQMNGEIDDLKKRIDSVREQYWSWVEGNGPDEQVYFSKWAKILGISAEIFKILHKSSMKSPEILLKSIIQLYKTRRYALPVPRSKRGKNKKTIELENLRSDDLPDIDSGLNDFFAVMCDIKNGEDFKKDNKQFRKLINSYLKSSVNGGDCFKQLGEEHFRLLDAVDEYDKEFGKNQKFQALNRCVKRIKWLEEVDSKNGRDKCKAPSDDRKDNLGTLLKCNILPKPKEQKGKIDVLDSGDYESIMSRAESKFTESLQSRSIHSPVNTLHFIGLQRWNSLTPAQGRSVGGGYFLYHTSPMGVIDLGIAIDPGFDFVRNFFRNGFSIRDIDIVLISHAHADHLWDFESIVQLLNELDDKEKIKHRINVVLTLGIYRRYEQHVIRNPKLREYIEPFVIDIRKEIDPDFYNKIGKVNSEKDYKIKYCFKFIHNISPKDVPLIEDPKSLRRWIPDLPDFAELKPTNATQENNGKVSTKTDIEEIEVWPTRSYHDDYSNISDSFGFKIIMKYHDNNGVIFGYTGDTKWVGDDIYNEGCPQNIEKVCSERSQSKITEFCWENIVDQYRDCNVLLMHLGSLIDRKDNEKKYFKYYDDCTRCDALIREKNHPYLIGMIRFLRALYKNKEGNEKLILIGEFGEELCGGIRIDITKRLQDGITPEWKIIPVDVGLDVVLRNEKQAANEIGREFICALCDRPASFKNIEYRRFGHDEAIFYICKTCDKAFPEDVRQNRFRQLYEIGRELKPEL